MNLKSIFINFFLMALISLAGLAQEDSTYVEGEIVLKVATPFTNIATQNNVVLTEQAWFNTLSQQYQIAELKSVYNSNLQRFRKYYRAIFPVTFAVEDVVAAFAVEAEVETAIPNYIGHQYSDPNDPEYDKQWALKKIKADSAWQIESGNSSVIVGIVDSGIDLVGPHPDLLDNLWNENGKFGYNVLDSVQFPDDDNGHGTHVSGIAGAVTNNNLGIAGVAGGGFGGDDGIQIMSVKAVRIDGFITATDAAEGIRWAADSGAHIINMSFGFPFDSTLLPQLYEAVSHADSLGKVLIAAAGNDQLDIGVDYYHSYPAEYQVVMAVARTDSNDSLKRSNYGTPIDVCAPGGATATIIEGMYNPDPANIFATTPSHPNFYYRQFGVPLNYAYFSGTSMSSPMVAGLAALLKSYDNNLTSKEIRNLINGTAYLMPEQLRYPFAGKLGAGRINAYAALSALQSGISHPHLVYFGRDIIDPGQDKFLNAGETADLIIYLKNFWEDVSSVSATLTSLDTNITVLHGTVQYDNGGFIANGKIGSNTNDPFQLEIPYDIVPGEYAFNLQVNGTGYNTNFTFYLQIYNPISLVQVFLLLFLSPKTI